MRTRERLMRLREKGGGGASANDGDAVIAICAGVTVSGDGAHSAYFGALVA